MKKVFGSVCDDRDGVVMIESLWVMIVTTIVFSFLFCALFIFYQQWSIQTIADDAAAEAAQTYKTPKAKMNGYMTEEQIKKIDIYRYLTGAKTAELNLENEKRVQKYVKKRADAVFITTDNTKPEATLKLERDSHARRHVTVTIKGEYVAPFGSIMKFLGGKEIVEYEVSSTAECVDLIDYMNTVDYIDQVGSNTYGSKIVGGVNSVLNMFNKFSN